MNQPTKQIIKYTKTEKNPIKTPVGIIDSGFDLDHPIFDGKFDKVKTVKSFKDYL